MSGTSIRRATTADLTEIRRVIDDAYSKYIERIGRPPAPMTTDYAAALEHSRVGVLQVGFRVSRSQPREEPRGGCGEQQGVVEKGIEHSFFARRARYDKGAVFGQKRGGGVPPPQPLTVDGFVVVAVVGVDGAIATP